MVVMFPHPTFRGSSVRRFAHLLLPALLVGLLAACGGGSTSDGLPEVRGKYGAKPKITVAKDTAPGKKLASEVLTEGTGPKIAKGDLLVADYLGEVYRNGKVFDNSYDRGAPSSFTLKDGPGGVISGWVKSLTGVHVGSRVLLVAPPKEGYGKKGNPQAGIKGTDSLVFVVDVIARYNASSPVPESAPVTDLPEGLPAVTGDAEPTISVPKGTAPPKEPKTTLLATGTGKPVVKGQLGVVQYSAVDWTGKSLSSTWQDVPQGVAIGGEQPSPFDLLVGVPIGSRVLLELPAQEGADPDKESVAVVIDVLAQHGPAKDSAKGATK
jgi:peptidylprolyl isomerase